MLTDRKLYIDGTCEIIDLLRPYMTAEFYDFAGEPIDPGSVYIVGRKQLGDNVQLIKDIIAAGTAEIVFGNPHEGSETLMRHLQMWGIDDFARAGRLKIIGGGDMEPCYDYLLFDHFLPKILDYEENLQAIVRGQEIYTKKNKPYKFLFLNGRGRSHRRYMLEKFDQTGLLAQSLWTWLDANLSGSRTFQIWKSDRDLMLESRPVQLLPQRYEAGRYSVNANITQAYAKYELFGGEWGEIYLNADAYIDTYFSVVTETVFEYPYSFRTEKIWKPIAMGHPWIAVANAGYYRDMRALGFRTFDGLIDESFDSIIDNVERMDRIINVIHDLCRQDLDQFVLACRDICKYNQQHLAHMRQRVRQEFPERFFQWMT